MDSLEHFVRLARRGRHPGASGGERRAYLLAVAILTDAPGLDSDATAGLKLFIDGAQQGPSEFVALFRSEADNGN